LSDANLAAARADYDALSVNCPLKKQLRNQLRDAEAMTSEQRQNMRQSLIETVRRAEAQEVVRRADRQASGN
jgi:transcriptional antiterminator Rof (Rho-off)